MQKISNGNAKDWNDIDADVLNFSLRQFLTKIKHK